MELVAGRFEHEPQRRVRREAEAELGGRARRGAGDRAGKAAVDRAVQMAAEDALDLRMAGDYRSERLTVLQTGPVHALDAGRGRVDGASSTRPVALAPRRARSRARR